MICPPQLHKGDTVAVVAIADSVCVEKIMPGIDLLKSWGLNPVIGKTVGLRHHQFAGTDRDRRQDLQQQLDNPAVKAIFMARGGYGTVRIVDQLDFTKFRQNPKWIIGYSDITALHEQLQSMGYVSIHAEMPAFITEKSPEAADSLEATLFAQTPDYSWPAHSLNCTGQSTGELVGGNISILYSLLGSPTSLDVEGKILFMEDLGEYLYHIDRMMQNFKRNGWFDKMAGLLVGGLNNMKDNEIPFGQTAEDIIAEIARDYSFPVAFGFPAGHIYDNRALPLGQKATLNVTTSKAHLRF